MWGDQVWATIQQEFSDLNDPADLTRLILRLLVAMALGALLGYERESVGAAAGLRTYILVAMGSALFVLIPIQSGMQMEELSRVLQGITSGIGFLGAGSILKRTDQNDVRGLTTAAGIWLAAAVGVAAGVGKEMTALISALLGFVILSLVRQQNKNCDNGCDKGCNKPCDKGCNKPCDKGSDKGSDRS